jgi:hypothetical protein
VQQAFVLRFLNEPRDAPIHAALHDAEVRNQPSRYRFGRKSNVRSRADVLVQQDAEIHPVELVSAENEIIVEWPFEEVAHVLPNGVRCPLIPLRTLRRLLRGENVDKGAREIIELVARLNMSM